MTEQLIAFALLLGLLYSAFGWGQAGMLLVAKGLSRKEVRSLVADRGEARFFSIALGLGILAWLGLIIGWGGGLYRWVAWAILFVGALLSVWLTVRRHTGSLSSVIPPVAKALRTWPPALPLAFLASTALLYTLLSNTLLPPTEWDELAYHLALPEIYIEANAIIPVKFIVHSNWPMNVQMLFTWSLLLGSEMLTHLVTWSMSLLTAWGIFLIGKTTVNREVGLLAATFFLLIPLVLRLAGTGLIDIGLAFWTSAALLAYVRYVEDRSLARLSMVGLFSGIAAGTKLTGGAVPLLLGLLIAITLVFVRAISWRSKFKHVAVFGGFGLLMVGPWYLRSVFITGNPVWPFFFDVFGGGPFWDSLGDEYHTQQMMSLWAIDLTTDVRGLLQSMLYLFTQPEKLGGFGGIGRPLLLSALVGILFVLFRRRKSHPVHLDFFFFSAAYYLIWFFVLSRQVRFLFPIFPVICLLGGVGFHHAVQSLRKPLLQYPLVIGFILFMALNSPWVSVVQNANGELAQDIRVVTGQISRAEYYEAKIRPWPAFDFINRQLPADATVLLLPYENRGYLLDREYVWGHPGSQRIIPFEQYDDPSALLEHLEAMGITHILDNPEWIDTSLRHWEHDRALMLEIQTACSVEINRWNEIGLFQLTSCR